MQKVKATIKHAKWCRNDERHIIEESPFFRECENCGARETTDIGDVPLGWYVGTYDMRYGILDGIINLKRDYAEIYQLTRRACGNEPALVHKSHDDRVLAKEVTKYFTLGPIALDAKRSDFRVEWIPYAPEDFPTELIYKADFPTELEIANAIQAKDCPNCEHFAIYYIPSKRWRCEACGWEGTL